jgi:flagellar protein FlbD
LGDRLFGAQAGEPQQSMIKLTQLNGRSIVVNVDLIEFVESTPDTIVSLTTGKKILVKESDEEVIRRTAAFWRTCHAAHRSAESSTTAP